MTKSSLKHPVCTLRRRWIFAAMLAATAPGAIVAQTNPHGPITIECTNCHTTESWSALRSPLLFDHGKTSFMLEGAHVLVACKACHADLKFKGTASGCFPCHQTQYAAAKDPDHQNGRFPQECQTCHTSIGWRPSTFDHNKTNFVLTGLHRAVPCAGCHTGGRFAGIANDCFSCHHQDYAGAMNPNHVAGQYPTDCTTCHSTTGWSPAQFDHAQLGFPLTGAHAALTCVQCHAGNRFAGTPADCFGCHQNDFMAASNPNHTAGQFSHDCTTCHSMNAWSPASFDHARTSFPLTGAHIAVQCASCHSNGRFAGTPTDCYSCHQPDFAAASSPNHVLGAFNHDCSGCHTTQGWKPSTFNHANTGFPLTGVHATTDCVFCHKNGQFQGTPADCFSCHANDFTGANSPPHVSGGFSHDCSTCHTTSAWQPATFDHSKTAFPLTGAHMSVPCASCHGNGRFAGTPTDCWSCHQTDYNGATNPNHAAAKFPTTCQSCHTTSAWSPSTFDHTPYFPIGSGSSHRPGVWTFCSDCHTNASDYQQFSCITCHAHDKSTMDSHHSGVNGYVYDSAQCYRCHPNGRSD